MGTKTETDLAVHPGEFLREEIDARGITQAELARSMGRGADTINRICRGRLGISPHMAISLEEALGIRASSWLNLQQAYGLTRARHARERQEDTKRRTRPRSGNTRGKRRASAGELR